MHELLVGAVDRPHQPEVLVTGGLLQLGSFFNHASVLRLGPFHALNQIAKLLAKAVARLRFIRHSRNVARGNSPATLHRDLLGPAVAATCVWRGI